MKDFLFEQLQHWLFPLQLGIWYGHTKNKVNGILETNVILVTPFERILFCL